MFSWTISGWILTALSFLFGIWQFLRTKRLEKRHQEQMLLFINRANYVSFEHEFLDEILSSTDDKVVSRYLTSWHQAGCELYMDQVEFFLSLVDKFTYNDLKKLCNTPLISYQWQEKHWRFLVSQRKENRKESLPQKYWIAENVEQPRFAYYKRTKSP